MAKDKDNGYDDELDDEETRREASEEEMEAEEAYDGEVVEADGDTRDGMHRSGKVPPINTEETKHYLSGMYQTWFLEYASYVILERAVPNIVDGLKPVQRRILHSMKRLDDGRYNKVANIVGHTMQFHPHGDASIGDALVAMGQKNLLVDCQGNWGHILTGDSAAAPRYIEGRLSKFALEVLFSPKITQWKPSYDGRNKEPITLPVKFPILLAQGTSGIAVGLNTMILPHNYIEIADAAIAYLRGEEFQLYPDFPTGATLDVSKYNDGKRGGSVRIRAKINKIDNKTLEITEIPYGITAGKLKDSIIKANDSGKIKIKKVDDYTSEQVSIIIQLQPGTSPDKTIDALYAFTDCELKISTNCCVIDDNKPVFIGVSDLLRRNVDSTKDYLRQELEIQKGELEEQLFLTSLEKIFIENRIYKDREFEQSKSIDEAVDWIDKRLEPFKKSFIREVTREDEQHLMDIKMARIIKYRSDKADEDMAQLKDAIAELEYHLSKIVDYTITWFKGLKARYGDAYPRRTELRTFDTIEVTKVAEANEKLYINREEGFIGTGLRKDEYVCPCSDIDDIIVFYKDGKYKVVRVQEKLYVGKNVLHLAVFKKNDKRTVYNVVYRDGKAGFYYIKRFAVTSITRDKEYDITQGTAGSRIIYFTANANGEAEVIRVTHKPKARLKILSFEKDFSEIAIKGRQAMGNILTKNDVYKITLRHQGVSTLGGRKVWYDASVMRLNYDEHGTYLGEFRSDDKILVITKSGEYYTTSFDLSNHFDENLLKIEKYDPEKVWSVALTDEDQQGFRYIKRFVTEPSQKKVSFLGDNAENKLLVISDNVYPRFEVIFGGADEARPPLEIDVEQFVAVKGLKAKGKRVSTYMIDSINELEPTRFPEVTEKVEVEDGQEESEDDDKDDGDDLDEMTGQMKLF